MKSRQYLRAETRPAPHNADKIAFVTLVMLDDGYVPGAMLLGHSLRRQNRAAHLICMVTEEISGHSRDMLSVIFDLVIEVERLYVPCKRMRETHYLPYVFTKLNALLLCSGGLLSYDIEKVVFVDADVLPLKNYFALTSLPPPAGIINEYKSHFILTDRSNQYRVKATGKWHWHTVYDPVCPHGQPIPAHITDRVGENPSNMGIHGALMVMKPSVDEYRRIMADLARPDRRERIEDFSWPEMQYLTLRWSGSWTNIDLRYCGFKGYPSLDLLHGTHFAGVKPWRILDGRQDLFRLPDFRVWYDMYLTMYHEHRAVMAQSGKYRKLARVIRSMQKVQPLPQVEQVEDFERYRGFR